MASTLLPESVPGSDRRHCRTADTPRSLNMCFRHGQADAMVGTVCTLRQSHLWAEARFKRGALRALTEPTQPTSIVLSPTPPVQWRRMREVGSGLRQRLRAEWRLRG